MKIVLINFALVLILSSCWNPTYKVFKELESTEFDNEPELLTAKKAIEFIGNSQLDSLKAMFPDKIVDATNDNDWEDIINKGKKAINLSKTAPDSMIEISNTINMTNGTKQIFAKLSFPYGHQGNDSAKKFINIITSEGQLYGLNIGDYPFGMRIIEPQHNEPHLANHSLVYSKINWFRIWYGSGYQKNEYGDSYGYYAVSGDKKKIDELEIEAQLSELFKLINEAKIDSIDFKYLRDEDNGDPEYIYLRFKFDNEPYKSFGEFSIYYFLSEEPSKSEPLSNYIILKHSDKTRYLIRKNENLRIVELLKDISYRNYDKHDEKRWH